MLKKSVLLLVVCTCVSVAFGAANKIKEFQTFDPEPEGADGMAILNFTGNNQTIFQLMLSDFSPTTGYDYFLVTPGAVLTDVTDGPVEKWQVQQSGPNKRSMPSSAGGFLVTNGQGHLTFHTSISGDFLGDISNYDVLLFANAGNKTRPDDPIDTGRWVIEGELRAEGRQSP